MSTDEFIRERTYLSGVSKKTLEWYRWSFRAFNGALDSRAAVIGRIGELKGKNSNISINTYLRAVNAYFMWLHTEHGKELVRIPRLKEEQKILATLSADQVRALVNFKPVKRNQTRAWTLALSALDTGLRIHELLGLSRQNVDLDNLTLRVKGKGNKERVVPMSIELRKVLYRYLSRHEHSLVFCTQKGGKITQRNALRDFKAVCRKLGIAGVRCSFHTLRHSFAVGYLRRGGNLEFLRRILGHTSLSTTQKYLRSLGVEDLQAVHNELSLLSHG